MSATSWGYIIFIDRAKKKRDNEGLKNLKYSRRHLWMPPYLIQELQSTFRCSVIVRAIDRPAAHLERLRTSSVGETVRHTATTKSGQVSRARGVHIVKIFIGLEKNFICS